MTALPPSHPLIARLTETLGYPALDPNNLESFIDAPGDGVIFCGGDPLQYPECLDVAVVLPELLRAFPGRLRAGVAVRELDPILQGRFGLSRWPSLLFVRSGAYVGILAGMLDWPVYLARIQDLLAGPVGRPPAPGIAVRTASATCH
jgi:hydrogenase-1 operon protein HyaE